LPALLAAERVWASYGGVVAVRDVSLEVPAGSLVAILGANGAGKSTFLRVLAGLHRPDSGRVVFDGTDLAGLSAHAVARRGVVLVPEGRAIFPSLTVSENVRIAARDHAGTARVQELFPILGERMAQRAGTLSGGEQQMLALARCVATEAPVLLLDEPSLALAPRMVDQVFGAIRNLRASGRTIVLVEQYVGRALEMSDLVYVMEKGTRAFAGEPEELSRSPVLAQTYLGGTTGAQGPQRQEVAAG
jgi:branched-chain amino acid transport system ATP-binding protein